MQQAFRFLTSALTHVGHVRSVNEDSHVVLEPAGIWAVADGMGGHENGRWASQTIVEALATIESRSPAAALTDSISDAILNANQTIFLASEQAGKRMGSTAVVLLIQSNQFYCFWVGDSRIYLLRNRQLIQLTRDHTQVQEMVERGLLTAEEANGHPMSNILSRAVGVEADLQIDAIADQVRPKDVFLLCSDGLTGLVSDAEILERLLAFDPVSASNRLLELVLSRGAHDNVTLIAVGCEERTALNLPGSPPNV